MNVNFGIIRKFFCTLLSMVQLGSNRLKMIRVKASHMSTICGGYFPRSKFLYLDLFRYLQDAVLVSKLCSFSIFYQSLYHVFYNILTAPLFSMTFVICLIASLICLVLSFCCNAVFARCSDNHVC